MPTAMQVKAAVVILATCVVLATGRSNFLAKRGSSQEKCGDDLMQCVELGMAYQAEMAKAGDVGDFVQSATIRQHCNKIIPITTCITSTVRGSCAGVFAEDERKMITNAVALVDYVCVDNLDAFEANEQCFQEVADMDDDLQDECDVEKLEQCDVSGVNRCFSTAMSRAPSCNADSQRLFNGFMAKMIKVIPGCKARRQLQRVVELIMYRN